MRGSRLAGVSQILGLLILVSCSSSTNVMGLIAKPQAQRDAGALLSRSKILMDQGQYAEALDLAEHAFQLAPDCAACAIQVGYGHLSVAGLDLFQLIRKMLTKDSATADPPSFALLADSNAAGQLASLATLVGLQAEDYTAITLDGNRLGSLEGAPSSGPFRSLPVLLPKTAPLARESTSATLWHIAQATQVICPFMPDEVKLLGSGGDIRHNDPSCQREGNTGELRANALFIWAMSHLVEAIAFHEVVLYQPDGVLPNLQKRAALLEDKTIITSLVEYIGAVKDLASVVDLILPTQAEDAEVSMLTAMFNDLQTVSLAFQNMLAVPPALSQGIIDSIQELQGQKDKISGSSSGQKDNTSVAFKDQLTAGMANELQKQITAKIDAGQLSDKDKTDLCSAYRQISTQAFASCDSP